MSQDGKVFKVYPAKSEYSLWRRSVEGYYCADVDFIEWRVHPISGEYVPVALIETTLCETMAPRRSGEPWPIIAGAVVKRFEAGNQAKTTRYVADKLGVPAYLVLAQTDMAAFFVLNLKTRAYRFKPEPEYRRWIIGLPFPAPTRIPLPGDADE